MSRIRGPWAVIGASSTLPWPNHSLAGQVLPCFKHAPVGYHETAVAKTTQMILRPFS
jgi:hypothetical protein